MTDAAYHHRRALIDSVIPLRERIWRSFVAILMETGV